MGWMSLQTFGQALLAGAAGSLLGYSLYQIQAKFPGNDQSLPSLIIRKEAPDSVAAQSLPGRPIGQIQIELHIGDVCGDPPRNGLPAAVHVTGQEQVTYDQV